MKESIRKQPSESVQRFFYPMAGTDLEIPVVVVKGRQPDATLLITAGIHGSEYPGIEAAKELSNTINPKELQGTLIILPCINQRAFFERAAFVNPTDGKNLNRCFPGNPKGSETERIAYQLTQEFFPLADFYLDFHSGDLSEQLEEFVFIPSFGPKETIQAAHQGARYLDVPFGVVSKSKIGASNCACLMGVPALLIERGGFGERAEAAIQGFMQDALSILSYLGMCLTQQSLPKERPLLEHVQYLDSPQTGLWMPAFAVGDRVETGESLGRIENFFGEVLWEGFAQQRGQVLYQVAGLPIVAGEHLIAYG